MRRIWMAGLAVVLAMAAPVVASPRDDALRGLEDREDTDLRRQSVRMLAQAGTMADVPRLVQALRDPDHVVRVLAAQALWDIWSRSGNQEIDRLFATGTHAMTEGRWDDAVAVFTGIIARDPDFAEGWNKRATVYFLMGAFEKSLADCDEVMKRNPYHYGALSGYGMIYMRLEEPERALEYFEQALRVNPNMAEVRNTVELLRALLINRRKNAI
jgi:tetratricopeptide (TPR) repeat protein